MKTTNYYNTLIIIAEDCPATVAVVPPVKEHTSTVANLQFEMIGNHPYQYTSDDVVFQVYAVKNHISKSDMKAARDVFFSRGQACLRCSPLCKRYGWGIHSDAEGKVALYAVDSKEYSDLLQQDGIKLVKAMRSKK